MSIDAAGLDRLRRLLRANLIGLWGSVLVLGIMRLTFTADRGLTLSLAVLTVGGLIAVAALACARRGRIAATAALLIAANWISAVGVAVASPFIWPVGLFALVLPIVLLFEFLSDRLLLAALALTVPATGVLAGVGETLDVATGFERPGGWVTVLLVAFFVSAVVAVTAVGLWNQTHRLTEQALALESSRRRLSTAADDARRGIERDLHDGAQQQLSTLSVRLGRVARLVEQDPAAARVELEAAHAQLHDAIRELRDLAHGIYPAVLEQRGLGPALQAAARRGTLPCIVDAAELPRYPVHVENAVYFCCLEAIHNADRHSGAAQLRVTLRDEDGDVVFAVQDDGHGFDPAAVTARGLTGMADRVRAAGGVLEVLSTPGRGMTVAGRVSSRA